MFKFMEYSIQPNIIKKMELLFYAYILSTLFHVFMCVPLNLFLHHHTKPRLNIPKPHNH